MAKKKWDGTTPSQDDDIGFDEDGQPFMIGAEARAEQDRIVDSPDAKPVLVVAVLDNAIGVRVYGPPAFEIADMLDQVAAMYRKAVVASRGPRQ